MGHFLFVDAGNCFGAGFGFTAAFVGMGFGFGAGFGAGFFAAGFGAGFGAGFFAAGFGAGFAAGFGAGFFAAGFGGGGAFALLNVGLLGAAGGVGFFAAGFGAGFFAAGLLPGLLELAGAVACAALGGEALELELELPPGGGAALELAGCDSAAVSSCDIGPDGTSSSSLELEPGVSVRSGSASSPSSIAACSAGVVARLVSRVFAKSARSAADGGGGLLPPGTLGLLGFGLLGLRTGFGAAVAASSFAAAAFKPGNSVAS